VLHRGPVAVVSPLDETIESGQPRAQNVSPPTPARARNIQQILAAYLYDRLPGRRTNWWQTRAHRRTTGGETVGISDVSLQE
jgi:hypothetical protein